MQCSHRPRGRARSGIAWIAVGGILLAGVVFVNVAVLRLNLSLDKTTQQRTKLHAGNARLASQLSSQLAQATATITKNEQTIQALSQRLKGIRVGTNEPTIQKEDGKIVRVPDTTTVP